MRTLVLADGEVGAHGVLSDATLRVIGAAISLGHPVDLLVFDAASAAAAAQASGVARVLSASAGDADTLAPETVAAQLQALATQYSTILAPHRARARAALPRAAALAGGAFLADVIALHDGAQFVRGLYAGSVIATVASATSCTFATVRPTSFAPVAAEGGAAQIVALAPLEPFTRTRLVERRAAEQSGQDLGSARVVIAGGRGLASPDNMTRLGRLANTLGAALGASRAAVDAGYAPNAAQVGQTGRSVAPDVYVAFGISGAIQHLAGMKDSKFIVAVNKDPDAPIFSVADVGLVGDLFDVVGALETRLAAQEARA
ncbi:electron transfer flavoprotein alpha subunit [Paraburkholderia bannensis]|uniref:Electron transfer flavoprotein subunit alpha n=1 Tax=Paraburkholderia bannensis TaxID=765414 RepID=A0A7W9U4B9_9BURK|nr:MULTISPECIES: electron transfer flavoprotein subunit alpha/FixB family protein [Paraburkholderia]MBB3260989.1 electron transfer flavoprotein alpha subunit [Paraburkholderia sp. WP4_3_2]MBB6106026.1 electron transfer flavoprotein alpha subunit [Paraburkholderia bannensis]